MPAIGPFLHPVEGVKPAPPPQLTEFQQKKYDELLANVRSWESLPTSAQPDSESTPLTDDERMWLTRECLLRYLRATKWQEPQAAKRLRETLVWRRGFGVAGFTAEHISSENETGKQVILGFDNEGRSCLYMLPNKQNTPDSPKQIQHVVYMLERAIDLTPPGQETLALLIDFRNSSSKTSPSIATSREVQGILQNHYPERLGRAYLEHLPWYVSAMLKIIGPFIDPVTKTKIKYNEPLTGNINASQLMKNAGGEVDFEYEHGVYWPAMNQLAAQRRAERKERWQKAGGHIGESEVYLWGGEAASVHPVASTKQEAVNGLATEPNHHEVHPLPIKEDTHAASSSPPIADLQKLDIGDEPASAKAPGA